MKLGLIGFDDGYYVNGDLCRIPTFDDDIVVGLEQETTSRASEQSTWDEGVGVGECVIDVKLLMKISFAPRAGEAPIEGVEIPRGGSKDVFLPFNSSPDVLGVHLFEDAHESRLSVIG